MYYSTRPADWTDQAWIDWLHEELSTVLHKISSVERGTAPFDYAVHMADPTAQADDFHREQRRRVHESEQLLYRAQLELTQLNLDHIEFFRQLHDATPDAAPLEIRTDLPPEEIAAQMVRIGEHFRDLLDPLALNSLYTLTDRDFDDAECPHCFGDAFRRKGTADDFVCANCHHRFPYAERSTRPIPVLGSGEKPF